MCWFLLLLYSILFYIFFTFVTLISPLELMLCIILLLQSHTVIHNGGICPPLIKGLLTYLCKNLTHLASDNARKTFILCRN